MLFSLVILTRFLDMPIAAGVSSNRLLGPPPAGFRRKVSLPPQAAALIFCNYTPRGSLFKPKGCGI
jgi:hypothetical protein